MVSIARTTREISFTQTWRAPVTCRRGFHLGNQVDGELTFGGVNSAYYTEVLCASTWFFRDIMPPTCGHSAYITCAFHLHAGPRKRLRKLERLHEVGASSALASACGGSNACGLPAIRWRRPQRFFALHACHRVRLPKRLERARLFRPRLREHHLHI